MNSHKKATLWNLLQKHNNDYGFNPYKVDLIGTDYPSLSVIVPYYNTGRIFEQCIGYLRQSADYYPGKVEVIVVDDGSTEVPANRAILKKFAYLINHKTNKGRTEARNTGLRAANGKVTVFMDSDVMIDREQLWRHASLHRQAEQHNVKPIVVSFFQFINELHRHQLPSRLNSDDIRHDDYRLTCTYGPTWIGCDEDKAYVGQYMEILNETRHFKDWHGQYKAWVLPNMILGGLFSVLKEEIVAVGGFDSRFKGYGFTETSAVTKMIALRNNMVIPSVIGGGIHIDDPITNIPRNEKDKIFWERHDYYFNTFLKEDYKIIV